MAEGGIGSEVVVDAPVVDAPAVQKSVASAVSKDIAQTSMVQDASQPPAENADQILSAEEAVGDPASKQIIEELATEDIANTPIAKVSEEPVVEKTTESPVVKDQSDVSESKSEAEAIADLENDPDVVEHVSHEKVEALVRKIGEFYDVPELAIEQGRKTEIYVVKNSAFNEGLEEQLINTLSEEDEKELDEIMMQKYADDKELIGKVSEFNEKKVGKPTEEKVRMAKEHAGAIGGVCFPQEKGGSKILVKEDSDFDREHSENHELLHAMSVGRNLEYEGFNEGLISRLGFSSNNNLNEATTELLTLTMLHPSLTIVEMFNKVKSGEIVAGYTPNVLRMLAIINSTSQNKEPFTVKELAKYYFHDFEGEDDAASLLKNKFIEKIRPDLYRKVEPWLLYDLKDAEN
jgi:hypothetical protein